MRKNMLYKNVGQFRRLWPLPFRYDAISQSFLPQMDDLWHCQSIDEEQEKLVLVGAGVTAGPILWLF